MNLKLAGDSRDPLTLFYFCLVLICTTALAVYGQKAKTKEEHAYVDWEIQGMKLFLRHVFPVKGLKAHDEKVVIFLHGTNLPSSGNAAFAFEGRSWMSDLAENGYDVWALDYAGYGKSSRYPEMDAPASTNPPLGRAEECVRQLDLAVRYILRRQKVKKISIIGDSRGSIVAGIYATREQDKVNRLVLFGPITPNSGASHGDSTSAYVYSDPVDLARKFDGWAPAGGKRVLDKKYLLDIWVPIYLESDPTSRKRNPPSVRIPNGAAADSVDLAKGHFPYDPAKIISPTLVIRGEWDPVTTDEGGLWLFSSLKSARLKRYVIIGNASHVVQYEESRFQLYREVQTFLDGDDLSPEQHKKDQ